MIKHPAKYTDSFIPKFAELLNGFNNVLDPFAGIGKLALIKKYGFKGSITCNEIEKEWTENSIYDVDEWKVGDAANMDWADTNYFEAICTSPTYGNRMADHFNAKDTSKRITYRHFLGKSLNENNTGRMQWGKKYKEKHIDVYKECKRVLKSDGLMILNISDHIRKGEIMSVVDWHENMLLKLNMKLINRIKIKTPRMRFGQNNKARIDYEEILIFQNRK